MMTRTLRAALPALLVAGTAESASLNWQVNTASQFDHGVQTVLPSAFGSGEFTLEVWIRPDDSLPIGSTAGNGQLQNWSSEDNQPYGSATWWYYGNFLLDGHNNTGDFSSGTFTLQFYAGGRVRWLFGDGASSSRPGGVWSVGAYPGNGTASLLDGQWHHVTLVRRWEGTSQARLELWVDGSLVDFEISSARTNMRQWWNTWSGFPPQQAGWFWGAEKQAALGSITWEDYKGLIDELRFWSRAKTASEIASDFNQPVAGNEPGLVGWYRFGEGSGSSSCDTLTPASCMQLFNTRAGTWSTEDAPLPSNPRPSPPTNLQVF